MLNKVYRHYKKGILIDSIKEQILSVNQKVLYNGIYVKKKRRIFSNRLNDRPHCQGGEIKAHRKFTEIGDKVLVIGGGIGVSAINAAKIVGKSGKVIVYESNKTAVNHIKNNISLNGVSSNCEVIHGVVGEVTDDKFTLGEDVKKIPIEDLPECDVIEMDCEGAEVEILKKLIVKPRVIIVEIHPHRTKESPDWVLFDLKSKGYDIEFRSTTGGYEIDETVLLDYLNKNKKLEKQSLDPLGEPKWPVVVAGYLNRKEIPKKDQGYK